MSCNFENILRTRYPRATLATVNTRDMIIFWSRVIWIESAEVINICRIIDITNPTSVLVIASIMLMDLVCIKADLIGHAEDFLDRAVVPARGSLHIFFAPEMSAWAC